ncbi:uncharacterized protein LOC134533543 [Bacillus rossius redtenbacheri]|uniref:uncharacterized protein LOC134533543 n=1 Tax=Bacillus rossius redtenbacheri TaxID=93214 RepID=UPI002FDEFF64
MRNFGQNAFLRGGRGSARRRAGCWRRCCRCSRAACCAARCLRARRPPTACPTTWPSSPSVCGKFASGDSATLPRACEGAGSSGSACADEELEQQIVMFTVEARPEQEQREQRPAKRWAGAFSQNLVFLVAALPVLLLVLIDALFSAVTLCLLCRSPPRQGPQHFRLLFNFAFFQSACGGLPPPPPPARGRARSPAK